MSAPERQHRQRVRLLFLLDLGTRLVDFAHAGTLERELAVYRRMQETGLPVTIMSWARGEDREFLSQVEPMEIEQNLEGGRNRPWLVRRLWSLLCPRQGPSVVLVNQIAGSELALPVCRLRGRPLLVRCGYLRSDNVARVKGTWSAAAVLERLREVTLALGGARFIVSAPGMKDALVRRYFWLGRRIHVLPNYVDVAIFRPLPREDPGDGTLRLAYAGRLSAEKNLDLLVKAVARCRDVHLTLYGSGEQQSALRRLVESLDAPVSFAGRVQNEQLPERYRDADVFALVSKYEGNPKALLEAMSCQLCVIATNVPGIREVVADGKHGLLVDATVEAIAGAIDRLRDPRVRGRMGHAGRQAVTAGNSLDNYARELRRIVLDAAEIPNVASSGSS